MSHPLSRLFLCSTSTARIRRSMIKTRIRIKVGRRRGRKNDRRKSLIAGEVCGSNDGLPNLRRKSEKRRKNLREAKINVWDQQLVSMLQY
jgi:hypothetical protein